MSSFGQDKGKKKTEKSRGEIKCVINQVIWGSLGNRQLKEYKAEFRQSTVLFYVMMFTGKNGVQPKCSNGIFKLQQGQFVST